MKKSVYITIIINNIIISFSHPLNTVSNPTLLLVYTACWKHSLQIEAKKKKKRKLVDKVRSTMEQTK